MTRQQRQLIIEAFRMIKIRAEEGERLARAILTQDIGATTLPRQGALVALKDQAANIAEGAANLTTGIGLHIGAVTVLDVIKYPRAKTLSTSRPKSDG